MEKGKEQKVIERIHEIAKKLRSEGESFTRSDLAYELRSFGIESDSQEITRLVWKAWDTYGKSKDVENAFTNNAGNQSLVSMYQASAAIDNSDISTALKIIHDELSESETALTLLKKEIESALYDVAERMGTSTASVIKGTAGIERVKNEAENAFGRYVLAHFYE